MDIMQIEIIQENISNVFAMPEQAQAAEWVRIIEVMDEVIAEVDDKSRAYNIEARDIYISIAKEAKYFS